MDPNVSDIILSAGHGGADPGAVGQGMAERDLAIAVTNRVTQIMWDKFKFTTIQLPNETGDLVTEINQCNSYAPSLESAIAVQIHFNAGGGTGTEVWYPSHGDEKSRSQASVMANNIAALSGLPNRGIKDASTNGWGKLGWTDDTNCYALLIECPFIDRDQITPDLLENLAMGIANGLGQIFGQDTNQPKPVPVPIITTKTELRTEPIAFSKTTYTDDKLSNGIIKIVQMGVNGVKTFTSTVTYTDGKETNRVSDTGRITTQPVEEKVAIGTYIAPVYPDTPLDIENNTMLKKILEILQNLIAKITSIFK